MRPTITVVSVVVAAAMITTITPANITRLIN
jgi:hypothetical protein